MGYGIKPYWEDQQRSENPPHELWAYYSAGTWVEYGEAIEKQLGEDKFPLHELKHIVDQQTGDIYCNDYEAIKSAIVQLKSIRENELNWVHKKVHKKTIRILEYCVKNKIPFEDELAGESML
jgi:hypothetical protein